MQKTLKKELSFSLDTLERYRAKYGRSASLDTSGHTLTASSHTEPQRSDPPATVTTTTTTTPVRRSPPPSLFKANSPPKMTKLQELQQKKEAYLRAKAHEREMEQLQRDQEKYKRNGTAHTLNITKPNSSSNQTITPASTSNNNTETTKGSSSSTAKSSTPVADQTQQTASKTPAGYSNWGNSHATLCSQPWCAISDLMYFCDKYEFKTLSTRDLKTHQEIVAEVRALLSGKAPFDQRTRFPGNIHDPENLWVCIGRCASVEYHLQRIISVFRKPLNQLTPDKQRTVRQNFHLAVSELRLDISARISEVRLYDRLVFEREFRLEWQDEA